MRQTQKVLWTKGALLSPQHLQAQDRFLEDLIEFQLSSLCSFPCGFARLEIDREALAGGLLALSAASGLFPDGLPFDAPHADLPPTPKPLEEHWDADAGHIDIFLAVPEHRPGGHNVSAVHNVKNTRFVADVQMRRDENTGLAEKPIQLARKNLRLLTGRENLEGNVRLQVARVVRSAAGFELDPRFVPPLLDVSASEFLLAIARRLVEILTARSTSLSGLRRQRNRSVAEFGASDVANFWLLYTVNTHLPRFRHLYEVRRGHPEELYAAMLALAGALTTFSMQIHPRSLPVYEHANPGRCFAALDEQLRELLETVVPATHVTLPLRITQPSVYAVAIDQERYFGAPQMYLSVRSTAREDEMLRRVPQLVKVSSADQIERLIRQALPGVALRHVPNAPSTLPVKLDHHYFVLERTGPEWDAVRASRNLAAYVPSDFPDPVLELVILLPPDGR
jgi:type VI secretion system protein ImpJ